MIFWPPRSLRSRLAPLLLTSACSHGHDIDPARLDWMEGACRNVLAKGPPNAPAGTVGHRAARNPEATQVVLYGAEWCGACNVAVAYLRRRSIPFVEKDVEEDPDAAEEARALAREAHIAEDSLPVIDVRGTVMVGFMPCVLEQAWSER